MVKLMFKQKERGTAVVEFAVVLPLLVVFLFAIIEFSILFFDKAMLTNASREGARVGIVFVGDRGDSAVLNAVEKDIKTTIEDYCASSLISFSDSSKLSIKTTWSDGPDSNTATYDSGDILTVEVTYNFNFLMFSKVITLIGGSFSDVVNLEAVTIMRLE